MRPVQILAAAAVGSLLLSCYNPGVYVPPELAAVPRLEVKGRGGGMRQSASRSANTRPSDATRQGPR